MSFTLRGRTDLCILTYIPNGADARAVRPYMLVMAILMCKMIEMASCANACRDARPVRPLKRLHAFAPTTALFACYSPCADARIAPARGGDCNKKRAWLVGSRARCDGVWGAKRPFMARRATGMDGPNACPMGVVRSSCAGNGPISSRVLPRVRGARRQDRVLRRCRSECHRALFGASCNCR